MVLSSLFLPLTFFYLLEVANLNIWLCKDVIEGSLYLSNIQNPSTDSLKKTAVENYTSKTIKAFFTDNFQSSFKLKMRRCQSFQLCLRAKMITTHDLFFFTVAKKSIFMFFSSSDTLSTLSSKIFPLSN